MKKAITIPALCIGVYLLAACGQKKADVDESPSTRLPIESLTDSLPAMTDSSMMRTPDESLWNDNSDATSYSESFSPYDDGYEQGKEDGRKDGVKHASKASYDDVSDTYEGTKAVQYATGYSEGYDQGYEEGKNGGDFDRGYDAGFYGEHRGGFDSDNFDPMLDGF